MLHRLLVSGVLVASTLVLALLASPAHADTGCASPVQPPVSSSGAYLLSTPAHLQWLKDANVNGTNGQFGDTYQLQNDISLAGCTWTSQIANGGTNGRFTGTFDGQGYSVRNLTLTTAADDYDYVGFIGYVLEGTVRDLHVDGTVTATIREVGFSFSGYAGIAVGYAAGFGGSSVATIANVSSSGTIELRGDNRTYLYVGGVLGNTFNSTVSGLNSTASVTATTATGTYPRTVYMGGVVGYSNSPMADLDFDGTMWARSTDTLYAGGLVALATENLTGTLDASAAITTTSTSTQFIGGVVGQYTGSSVPLTAHTRGSLTAISSGGTLYMGGLVGDGLEQIHRSSSSMDITAYPIAGGFYGGLKGNGTSVSTISESFSTGDITVSYGVAVGYGNVGGIAGYNGLSATDVYSTGDISVSTPNSSGLQVGGITGYAGNSRRVTRAYHSGTISVTSGAGTPDAFGVAYGGSGSGSATNFCREAVFPATCDPDGLGQRLTLAQMQAITPFSDAGWSITEGCTTSATWGICPSVNGGTPYLGAFHRPPQAQDPSQLPPPWVQGTTRDAGESCPTWASASWDYWPNGGAGGHVCTWVTSWDPAVGRWRTGPS